MIFLADESKYQLASQEGGLMFFQEVLAKKKDRIFFAPWGPKKKKSWNASKSLTGKFFNIHYFWKQFWLTSWYKMGPNQWSFQSGLTKESDTLISRIKTHKRRLANRTLLIAGPAYAFINLPASYSYYFFMLLSYLASIVLACCLLRS